MPNKTQQEISKIYIIIEKSFEITIKIKSKWRKFKNKKEKKIVESNIIFAVRLQIISSIPKVILILKKMQVIKVLLLKKWLNSTQNTKNGFTNAKTAPKKPNIFIIKVKNIVYKNTHI